MAQRVQVRELTNDEGRKLLSILRRGTGSVVRWRRAQIVLWSAQAMDVPAIATIAFTSEDRVREVIHNFNDDGFDSLDAKYAEGRRPNFTSPKRHRSSASPCRDRSRPAVLDLVAVEAGRVRGR
jgi:transposase